MLGAANNVVVVSVNQAHRAARAIYTNYAVGMNVFDDPVATGRGPPPEGGQRESNDTDCDR